MATTPIGEVDIIVTVESGRLVAFAGAQVFEDDDERFPDCDLLTEILQTIEDNSNCDCEMLVDDIAVYKEFCETILNRLATKTPVESLPE